MFVLRRACCGGKRRQHHSQTARISSESGLRPPRSEMAPSGRLLPTAGRARARPHLAACAPGRLEQAAHGEKPPPRCGKSSGPSLGPKPRPSWLWRGSGCERPSSTAGGARQQAVGRCLPPPPDRGPEHRTRLSSRPGTLLGGIHRRAKSQPGARSRSATSLCGHFLRPNTVHSSPIGPPCAPQVVEILPLGIEILVPSAPPGPHPVPQPGGGRTHLNGQGLAGENRVYL